MDELDPAVKIGVAANLSRYYTAEGRGLLSPLARLLKDALGEAVELQMTGGFFSKKELSGVSFTLGEWRYALEDGGGDRRTGPLVAKRTRVVRGIALKTEDLPVSTWLEEVGLALEVEAQNNEATHAALSKLVW
ncbi:hypothetical protein IAD21_02362 [Abditibacteriota bacterium]|nr:hypothetical protein IAD21_02362 [Abditibacteriota bacterium]